MNGPCDEYDGTAYSCPVCHDARPRTFEDDVNDLREALDALGHAIIDAITSDPWSFAAFVLLPPLVGALVAWAVLS